MKTRQDWSPRSLAMAQCCCNTIATVRNWVHLSRCKSWCVCITPTSAGRMQNVTMHKKQKRSSGTAGRRSDHWLASESPETTIKGMECCQDSHYRSLTLSVIVDPAARLLSVMPLPTLWLTSPSLQIILPWTMQVMSAVGGLTAKSITFNTTMI